MNREYLKGDREQQRAYSRAVKVKGGTTIYLAGVGGVTGSGGTSHDFAGQTRNAFDRIRQNLADAGGRLDDITTMTVFITDARYGDEFVKIRKEFFSGDYPCSALITVAGLARPEMLVEIQAIAVLDT
ncbi:MAG: RidA family protein [Candidatus Binatia bacterium]